VSGNDEQHYGWRNVTASMRLPSGSRMNAAK
jgi:hypothetical protein